MISSVWSHNSDMQWITIVSNYVIVSTFKKVFERFQQLALVKNSRFMHRGRPACTCMNNPSVRSANTLQCDSINFFPASIIAVTSLFGFFNRDIGSVKCSLKTVYNFNTKRFKNKPTNSIREAKRFSDYFIRLSSRKLNKKICIFVEYLANGFENMMCTC